IRIIIRIAIIPHQPRMALIPHQPRPIRLLRRTIRRRRITNRGTAGICALLCGWLLSPATAVLSIEGGHVTFRDPRPDGNGGGYSRSRYIQIVRLHEAAGRLPRRTRTKGLARLYAL